MLQEVEVYNYNGVKAFCHQNPELIQTDTETYIHSQTGKQIQEDIQKHTDFDALLEIDSTCIEIVFRSQITLALYMPTDH